MFTHNKLGKILLLIIFAVLTACSGGGKEASPLLNADDIWDQMAEERQKPLPINVQTDDSDEILIEMPFDISSDPLSAKDVEAHHTTLRVGKSKFQTIMAALDAGFSALAQEAESEEDREVQGRTVQLYLSRLITLHNAIDRAMNALGDGDKALMDKNRDLLVVMAEHIVRTRSRLDGLVSAKE